MKIPSLLLVLLLLISACAFSQQFNAPKNEAELRTLIGNASSKIKSVQCDFVQEKKMSMMKDKITSKGVFYFNQPNQVRLEYQQPNFQAMIVNGSNAFLQNKSKTTKVSMAKSKAFQQLNKIIVSSITGSMLESKEFSTKLFENEKAVKVELIPTSKAISDFLSSIVLVLDKKDFSATKLELNENGGDYTYLTFSNKKINKVLPEELFKAQ